MRDDVRLSVRDLVTQMLTVSDNVATDHLIGLAGLDTVNELTASLGLRHTLITSDLRTMLDSIAVEVGFDDYALWPRTTRSPTAPRPKRRSRLGPPAASRWTPSVDPVRPRPTWSAYWRRSGRTPPQRPRPVPRYAKSWSTN